MRRWKHKPLGVERPVEVRPVEAPPPVPEAALPEPAPIVPTEDQIRARAFEIYRRRMERGLPGDAVSDWLQAERELTSPSTGPIEVTVRPTGLQARSAVP